MSSDEHYLSQDLWNFGAMSFSSVSMIVLTGFLPPKEFPKKCHPCQKHTDTITLNKKEFRENWEQESYQNLLADTVKREPAYLKNNSVSAKTTNLNS